MEKYELAELDYNNGMKYKDIAKKYDVSINTVKSWKQRYAWNRDKVCAQGKSMHTKGSAHTRAQPKKEKEFEPKILNNDLTDKQKLFCIYYLKYFNATKAYQKAYDCARSTAGVQGHKHLRNPKVIAEIDRLKAEQMHELKLDVNDILQKYIDIAFADITDFTEFGKKEVMTDEGAKELNYVDFKPSSNVDGTIVAEVKQGRDGVSIKLADKMKALEMLSKYFDLLSDNDKKRLQEEKLRVDIDKAKSEIHDIDDESNQTIIVNDMDEMRKVLDERSQND